MIQEESGHFWRGALIVLLVLSMVGAAVTAAWYYGKGPFAGRPGGVAQAAAAPEGLPAPVGCTAGIGALAEGNPQDRQVWLTPGTPMAVTLRCPAGATVVDLVVSLPPPAGVQGVLETRQTGRDGATEVWTWQGTVPGAPGTVVVFYPYMDGRPAGPGLVLRVAG